MTSVQFPKRRSTQDVRLNLNDPNQKMLRQWFRFAAADLAIAKKALAFSPEYKNIAGFHAQQCAEKAAKGFLTYHKVRFSKTHDLEKLGEEIAQVDTKLAKLVKRSKSINDLAVAYRYPDAQKTPLTVVKIKTAIKRAEAIYLACFDSIYGNNSNQLLVKNRKSKK